MFTKLGDTYDIHGNTSNLVSRTCTVSFVQSIKRQKFV